MVTKRRYLVAFKYGPKIDPKSQNELKTYLDQQKDAELVRSTRIGRKVLHLSDDHLRELKSKQPDLIFEEDQAIKMFGMPGIPVRVPIDGNYSISILATDSSTGKPIPNATIYALGAGPTYKGTTEENGTATIKVNEQYLTQIVVSAQDTYWSCVLPGTKLGSGPTKIEAKMKPLLSNGAYDWGHMAMGFRRVGQIWTGKEVKIGIIDSGISSNCKDLNPAGGLNALDGSDPKTWNVDDEGHGSHVAGIIAAKDPAGIIRGGAPDAKIYSLKVFPGGLLSDTVEAIEWCIHNGMDIISMSMGTNEPSLILAQALRDAYDRGIACFAASGNDGSHVSFPATLPTTIAINAIGCLGTFPQNSAHQLKIGRYFDLRGRLFAAKFNNFGPEIALCAPGVAILSTVPSGLAAWDGTSMACPMISSLAALILQAFPSIRTNDAQQVEALKAILCSSAFDLGMPAHIQGAGIPMATRALASAYAPGTTAWA